jgi:hypothetical protein
MPALPGTARVMKAGWTGAGAPPVLDASRVYRDAHARYVLAFRRGNVSAIEEAFSRMQDLGRAFRDGVQWAEEKRSAGKNRLR